MDNGQGLRPGNGSSPIGATGPAFTSLQPALSPWILEHLNASSFHRSTPVQASTIPILTKKTKDVIVEAVTGSGKTLAYLLPLLEIIAKQESQTDDQEKDQEQEDARIAALERDDGIRAVILLPTRELAIQVYSVLNALREAAPALVAAGVRPQLLVGGGKTRHHSHKQQEGEEDDGVGSGANTPQQDFARMRKDRSNVLIGTPGRMQELLSKNIAKAKAKSLDLLVLDEADRLLDLGFMASVTTILSSLPKQRRTALFSATMSDALNQLVSLSLRNPVRITVKVEAKQKASQSSNGEKAAAASHDARIPATLQNFFLVSPRDAKVAQLVRLLHSEPTQQGVRKVVVFFATCRQVEYFYKVLSTLKTLQSCRFFSLHGKQNPTRRSAVFQSFVEDHADSFGSSSKSPFSPASVLLCTDVASRGLDLPDLDLVIQFDPPLDPKVFNHRIGRTARAGKNGRAVCLLAQGNEEGYLDFMKLRGVQGKRYPYLVDDETNGTRDEAASIADLSTSIRKQNIADLATHDLFVLALVSYLRAYGKHEARFIFTMKDLVSDVRPLARSWGGVRLPRMSELKEERSKAAQEGQGDDVQDGWLDGKVDVLKWGYKEQARETARLAKLENEEKKRKEKANVEEGLSSDEDDKSKNTSRRKKMRGADDQHEEAWSNQKKRKERKDERKEKRLRKKKAINSARLAAAAEEEAKKKAEEDESDGFSEDEREFKKQRRLKRAEESRLAGERGVRGEKKRSQDGDDGFEMGDDDHSGGEGMEQDGADTGFFDDL
ncbi:unnamed protein product [Sympodiomycopsis kandeliae]